MSYLCIAFLQAHASSSRHGAEPGDVMISTLFIVHLKTKVTLSLRTPFHQNRFLIPLLLPRPRAFV